MVNIRICFILQNEHGTYIEGSLLLPYDDGVFYKPHTLVVYSGVLDFMHRFNSGKSSEKIRTNKEEIIKKYSETKGELAILKNPFVFNECKPFGFLGFSSNVLGISTNRSVNMRISNKNFNGLILPMLFQNLKSYTGSLSEKVIDLDQANESIIKSIKALEYLYHSNIDTASTKTQSIKIKEKHDN